MDIGHSKPYLKDTYLCLSRFFVDIVAPNWRNVFNNDKDMIKGQKASMGNMDMERKGLQDLEARGPMSDERMR